MSSSRAARLGRLVLLVPLLCACWGGRTAAAAARADAPPTDAPAAGPTRPNVVFILIDDMGWTDLGCFGSELYETPAADKLARDGVRFTQAYSACTVCSPTRAALMTGKYPARLHVTDWIPGQMPSNPKLLVPDWTKHLPAGEPTVADAFRAAGYATASIGKWHLGGEDDYPEKHGFDVNVAGTHAAQPPTYFAPYNIPTLTPEGQAGEYLTDRLGDEAVRFVERSKDKPFFLYLAHFAVHLPVNGRADLVPKYKAKLRPTLAQRNPGYAAMVEAADQTVAKVRAKLDELKLADRTIVIFTSDNGGRVPTTSNRPLRAGKGSCYEGGTRVPMIVHWPGVTRPGGTCDVPTITCDWYPTLLDMCGVGDLPGHRGDGVSLVPLLKPTAGAGSGGQAAALPRDALFWHYPHHQHYQLGGTMPYGAVRVGDFKLIEQYDDMRVELYNLRDDVGEQNDLAAKLPDKANALRKRLHAWRTAVGAQMPTPNPAYDPTKPQFEPKAANQGKAKAEPGG